MVEGRRGLQEAVTAQAGVETVYTDSAAARQSDMEAVAAAASAGAEVVEVQPGVLARVCDTVTPQPVAATVRTRDASLADLAKAQPGLIVVLAGVGDPGNAGSLLRSAAASGADGFILCEGSVDVYNPKTIRSCAGAIFRIPVVQGPTEDGIAPELRKLGCRLIAASAGGESYTEADLTGHVAIVLGNEAHGLPERLVHDCDSVVGIPMAGGSESLGVAAAGAVILFEAARQRRTVRVAGAA